jgi:hypothetical protein
MRLHLLLLVVGALVLPAQRHDLRAAQGRQAPLYGGTIAETCASWTADGPSRTSVHAQVQAAWVFGFVSGSAATAMVTRNGLSFPDDVGTADIETWLTKYCAEHPASAMPVATMRLVDDLMKRTR